MIAAISSRNSAWRCGATKKAIPPPDIPPSIRKPQKSSPSAAFASRMIDSVNALLTQGMIPLSGPSQFRVVSAPSARTSAGSTAATISSKISQRLLPGLPLARGSRSRYFSVTMFRIGPTFWAIPPWTRTRLSRQGLRGSPGATRPRPAARRRAARCAGRSRPRLTPHSGSRLAGRHAVDELDAREDAARVLPAAARAAEPLAEDRPGDDHPRLLGVERPGQVPRLAGRPHQEADQRGEQVRRDRQPRPLGDVVDLADDLQPEPRPDHPRQQLVEPGRASLRATAGPGPRRSPRP